MEYRMNRRLLSMLLMGFSSGLPLGLLSSTLQAWYTVSGASLIVIGWLTLVGQPYAFKFLWAPLLDRFSLFHYSRRKSWIMTMQFLLGVAFIVMGCLDPVHSSLYIAVLALIAAFFSATQDTAIDAYRTELLTDSEQGVGFSFNTIAYRVAMIASTGVALIIAAKFSWQILYWLMGLIFLLLMIVTIKTPNPIEHHIHPSNLRSALFDPWKSFFSRENAVWILVFIVIYKLCDAMALSLNTTFLIRGVGFSLIQIGAISKTVGLIGALVGSIIGGILLPCMGLYRSLMYFGLLQLLSNLLYAWLAVVGKNVMMMGIAVFGENFCSGLSTVALVVFLMQLCDKRFTATQYALFSAVASLGRIFVGPVSAELVKHMGWCDFYIASSLIGLPALLILWLLKNKLFLHRPHDVRAVT